MQEQPPESQSTSPVHPGVLVAGAGVIVALGAFAYTTMTKDASPEVTATPSTAPMAQETNDEGGYADGIYSVNGKYVSPGGDEQISVEITLTDGIITEALVEPQAVNPNSIKFQGIFGDNYRPFVIGKSIDDVKLDKISGSSLTPKGFNDALEQVKNMARSS